MLLKNKTNKIIYEIEMNKNLLTITLYNIHTSKHAVRTS